MSHSSDRQVGGTHYLAMDIQPWSALQAWMTPSQFEGYLLGSAVAYLARVGKKGPAREDVEKARHYLDKLLEVMP